MPMSTFECTHKPPLREVKDMQYGSSKEQALSRVTRSERWFLSRVWHLYIFVENLFANHFVCRLIGKDNPCLLPAISNGQHTYSIVSTVPPRYFSTSPTGVTFPKHYLRKHFYKPKTPFDTQHFLSHVHCRGHGYSNRFKLCRGCTLSPQDPNTYRVGIIPA